MPGYETKILRNKLEIKFLCIYCHLLLRDAIQTLCGHRYCRSCIDQLTSGPGPHRCIECGEENKDDPDTIITVNNVFPDNAIKRELGLLSVMCINTGCQWSGIFKDYEIHAPSCEFELISCIRHASGCSEKILRRSLAEHLEDSCQMRVVHCHYCNEEVVWKQLKSHHAQCPKFLIVCKFCGKQNIPREKILEHTDPERGDCERKVGPCLYQKVGCEELVEVEKMPQHLETTVVKHLDLIRDKVSNVSDEFATLKVNLDVPALSQNVKSNADRIVIVERAVQKVEQDLVDVTTRQQGQQPTRGVQAIIDKQSRSIEELKAKTIVLDTKVSTYEGIVAVLNGQIERDANVVQAMERERKQDRDLVESLERKIKSQDRIIALKDVALAEQDLRIQSLEMASYDGVLVWKISDFNRKRNDALSGRTTSIYSPCFFTSRHGYKMCARVYLNGDGMGKGNHVSLFFVIMRGTFDGLLRWPFRQKVTFMLLDQNNREHVIDAFRPDPTSNSFKRPTGDMNIASGCPLFMPLSQLESSRHAYVKDDSMFIKVIVDTTDLN